MAFVTNTVKDQGNGNLLFFSFTSSSICLFNIDSPEELDVVFEADIYSTLWKKVSMTLLNMLFVDGLHFHSLCIELF